MTDGSEPAPMNTPPEPVAPASPRVWREDGQGRRSVPEAVWAAVREDYLSGLSGRETCHLHGVELSAMRVKAKLEGWRRIDQPWAVPRRLDPEDEGVELEAQVDGDLDKVELPQLAYVANRRMMRAVMRGDAVEALRWRRVRLALDAEEAELARLIEQDEAIRIGRSGWPETDSSDSSDSSDSINALEGAIGGWLADLEARTRGENGDAPPDPAHPSS